MQKLFWWKVFGILAVVLTGLAAQAQFEEGIPDPPQIGTVICNSIATPALVYYTSQDESTRTIRNIIRFKFNELASTSGSGSPMKYTPSPFTATASIFLERWAITANFSNPTTDTETVSLTVNYDPAPGTKYTPISYLLLNNGTPGYGQVRATVKSVAVSGTTGGWTSSDVLPLLVVEDEMDILRYFTLLNNTAALTPDFTLATYDSVDHYDQRSVSWTFTDTTGNNFSQLEYAWIENETQGYYTTGGVFNKNLLFQQNSTRIDIDDSGGVFKYNIPLLFDANPATGGGIMYFRARAVQRKNDGNLICGPWSAADSFIFSGHQPGLNWQATTDFAENEKSKSVVQYYDGTLRPRQTVTKDNSTGNTVVAETIYDLQGRPNLQILPTPTTGTSIMYYAGFNAFPDPSRSYNDPDFTVNPAHYFDLTLPGTTCNAPPALDSLFGNGRYYSGSNPWIGVEKTANYIPNAAGYAYTETRYTDDPTQRVSIQGGVGLAHQLGNGHTTNYFYGQPGQSELDALFGTEAGDATHYFKNMVQDANGQISVSYVDMHGRTVATALAGGSPVGMSPIYTNATFYPSTSGTITDSMLTQAGNIIMGDSIQSINTILVSGPTQYHFVYSLTPAIFSATNCSNQPVCFDCKYDLEITFRKEGCADSPSIAFDYNNLQLVPAANACDRAMGFTGPGFPTPTSQITIDTTLSVGSWVVSKTLKIDDSVLKVREQIALNAFLCKTQASIYDSVLTAMKDSSSCAVPAATRNCSACAGVLSGFTNFKASYLASLGGVVPGDSTIYALYVKDSLDCSIACGYTLNPALTTLGQIRAQLLNDMVPYAGQYALPASGISTSSLQAKYNIFMTSYTGSFGSLGKTRPYYQHPLAEPNGAGSYYQEYGSDSADYTIYPGGDPTNTSILDTISPDNFTTLFVRDWAEQLIWYHPEYVKLRYAEDSIPAVFSWQDRMQMTDSYATALADSFMSPLTNDPYFTFNSNAGYVPVDRDSMNHYLTTKIHSGSSTGYSIWQLANGIGLIDTTLPVAVRQAITDTMNKTGIDSRATTTAQKDAVWQAFRSLYLGYRYDMVMGWINTHESGVLSGTAMTELQNEGKILHFARSDQQAIQDSIPWWSTVTSLSGPDSATRQDSVNAWLSRNGWPRDPCAGQRLFWQAQLMQCNVLQQLLADSNSTDSATVNSVIGDILDSLVMVCRLSVDGNNPQGATNVNPVNLPTNPATFEAVIDSVFNHHGIKTLPGNNWFCNPYSISYPKPYNANPPLVTTNKSSVDSCNCSQFSGLMSLASSAGVNTSSLSAVNAWLKTNYNDTLSTVLWTGLQRCSTFEFDSSYNCAFSGEKGRDTCDVLHHDILLSAITTVPVFLSCGYVKPCITCGVLKNLTDSFRVLFPAYDSVPYFSATSSLDTGKAQQNALWARYLNYKTGFDVTANDYIVAYLNCNLDSGAANLVLLNRGTQPPVPVGTGGSLLYAATTTVSFDSSYASNPQDEFETQIAANLSGSATAMCALNPPAAYAPPDTTVDPCASIEQQAQFVAQLLFQQLQDSLIRNFDSAYRARCLSVQRTESFYGMYTPHEYHYTLYYYDQAGNLVKTLPPDAVQPNYDPGYFASVAVARAAGTDMTNGTNIESLATQYRYNTLNQVIAQQSPDGGTSHFWYDRLGRLAVSQNAKQAGDPSYSYTLYDPLGRITEVGQKPQHTLMTQTISQDTTGLKNWLADLSTGGTKVQITRTVYDVPSAFLGSGTPMTGMNLRNRVVCSMVIDADNTGTPPYRAATYYSYDPHGNVDTLLQDYGPSGIMESVGNRYKTMVYNYDLASGKVNQVTYQPGSADRFYHQYSYDAENRITAVRTSRDSIQWEEDAKYTYYRHGPLARVELGCLKVQGLDYAYTLQGWLKSINPSWATPSGTTDQYDSDGRSPVAYFERDAYKLALNYFDDATYRDFTPISPNTGYVQGNGIPSASRKNLYNGNISSMGVDIRALTTSGSRDLGPMLYNYGYDQLNRISSMDAWAADGTLQHAQSSALSDYGESYTYDPNGNILTLNRKGDSAHLSMDQLSYNYIYAKTGGGTGEYVPGHSPASGVDHLTNQLSSIQDAVMGNSGTNDIRNQSAGNYTYDAIGELTGDAQSEISGVTWNVYGKMLSLTDSTTNTISFSYDASGNRISKTSHGIVTWYVRDGQGNVMSVYTENGAVHGDSLMQTELHLYGSNRLGVLNLSLNCAGGLGLPSAGSWVRGSKLFELTNHLGNVLERVSDKKVQHSSDNSTVDYYVADVAGANDYYSFGMGMPGRSIAAGYRYGFNGKEEDNEVKGDGDQIDYGMRGYDPRIGKFLSVDPLTKEFAYWTPYQFAGDNPIYYVDLDGLETISANQARGAAGESFIRSKLKLQNEYEVWEQITVRAESGTVADNTRMDFLVKKIGDNNAPFYKIEVKTGGGVNTENQNTLENAISNDELIEVRTIKPQFTQEVETGAKFRISGGITARVNPEEGQLAIENQILNPNEPTAKADLENLASILTKSLDKVSFQRILEDEHFIGANGEVEFKPNLPSVQKVVEPPESIAPEKIPESPLLRQTNDLDLPFDDDFIEL